MESKESRLDNSDEPETVVVLALNEERNQTVKDALRNNKRVVWWCFFFAMSCVAWGFDAQVNGAMISVPQFRQNFGYIYHGEPVLQASWQSAFNVISSVGQFVGGFICSLLADYIGRRAALGVGLVFSTAGIFAEVFANTNGAFLVGKMILGFGLGFYLTVGPMYCSEVAPTVLRGMTTSGINFAICIGQLLSNSAVRGFGTRNDKWAYAGPFAIQWLFVLVLAIGLPWAPESPWHLVRRGQIEAARGSLRQLYGSSIDVEPKLATIARTVHKEAHMQDSSATWSDCFKGTNTIRTVISTGVFACQHLSGIVFVLGYSTYFFELAGLPDSKSFDLGVGVTGCGVVGVMVSWATINNFGRRRLFLTGMISLTIILFLIGVMSVIPTDAAKWVEASLTVAYALFYQSTIGGVAYAILGETPAAHNRAKTMALATATQSAFGVVMNIAVPYMVNPDKANLKGKVGWIFGGLSLSGTIWAYLFVPELKGRTFDEVDELFEMKISPRKMGAYTSGATA